MKKMTVVTYTEDDRALVRRGINEIREVLMGEDMERKRSLLFCLDWFMDPYYGQDISSIEKDLVLLLQEVILAPNPTEVKEDALQLLQDYEWGPFELLEAHIEELDREIKPDALYVINMHVVAKVQPLVIEECRRIYEEARKNFPMIADRLWIEHYWNFTEDSDYDELNPADLEDTWFLENGTLSKSWEHPKHKKKFDIGEGGFFKDPRMIFNIYVQEKKVVLMYYFATRYGRCLNYELVCKDGEYSLENPKNVWTS